MEPLSMKAHQRRRSRCARWFCHRSQRSFRRRPVGLRTISHALLIDFRTPASRPQRRPDVASVAAGRACLFSRRDGEKRQCQLPLIEQRQTVAEQVDSSSSARRFTYTPTFWRHLTFDFMSPRCLFKHLIWSPPIHHRRLLILRDLSLPFASRRRIRPHATAALAQRAQCRYSQAVLLIGYRHHCERGAAARSMRTRQSSIIKPTIIPEFTFLNS